MNEETINVNTGEQQTEQVAQETKTLTFSQEEFDKLIGDRLAKQQRKLENQFNKQLKELSDAQKLQNMNEQEKQEFEYQRRIEELEAREKALLEKEDAYNKAQYKIEIQKMLNEAGLPDISDSLIHLEAEVVKSQIDAMKQAFDAKVNSSIESKLKQTTTPQEPTKQAKQLLTREQIENMSPQEYRANRDLINESLKAMRGQN